MQRLPDSFSGFNTIVGPSIENENVQQEQELLDASAKDTKQLTCYFCNRSINPEEAINLHHPIYKSRGGTEVAPSHEQCHRSHHSKQGDFREWGKKAASKKRWAFHLNNVRTHPAYEEARWFYLMNYADAGWGEF